MRPSPAIHMDDLTSNIRRQFRADIEHGIGHRFSAHPSFCSRFTGVYLYPCALPIELGPEAPRGDGIRRGCCRAQTRAQLHASAASRASLLAANAGRSAQAVPLLRPAPRLTIWPPPCSAITLAPDCMVRKGPFKLTANVRSQSHSSMANRDWTGSTRSIIDQDIQPAVAIQDRFD